jgi:ribosomal protein S18 acetylase RimI-like enzyme
LGGSAFGAFDDKRILGFSVLRTGLDDETAQLAGLYVDRAWRRRGLGRTLVSYAVESARNSGALRLYVSSSRYESAVDFYLSLGFRPIQTPDQRLFEMEPYDIHMSMSI